MDLEGLCAVRDVALTICGDSWRVAMLLSKCSRRLHAALTTFDVPHDRSAHRNALRLDEMQLLFARLIQDALSRGLLSTFLASYCRRDRGALGRSREPGHLSWHNDGTFRMSGETHADGAGPATYQCPRGEPPDAAQHADVIIGVLTMMEEYQVALIHPAHANWIYSQRTHSDRWRAAGGQRHAVTFAALRYFHQDQFIGNDGLGSRCLDAYRGPPKWSEADSHELEITVEDVADCVMALVHRAFSTHDAVEVRSTIYQLVWLPEGASLGHMRIEIETARSQVVDVDGVPTVAGESWVQVHLKCTDRRNTTDRYFRPLSRAILVHDRHLSAGPEAALRHGVTFQLADMHERGLWSPGECFWETRSATSIYAARNKPPVTLDKRVDAMLHRMRTSSVHRLALSYAVDMGVRTSVMGELLKLADGLAQIEAVPHVSQMSAMEVLRFRPFNTG